MNDEKVLFTIKELVAGIDDLIYFSNFAKNDRICKNMIEAKKRLRFAHKLIEEKN